MPTSMVKIRQPAEHDLVGRRFTVSGFGSGTNGFLEWRILDSQREILAAGRFDGITSDGAHQDFGRHAGVGDAVQGRGLAIAIQVFLSEPAGSQQPALGLDEVGVTLFTSLRGWRLHEVQRGDNLTRLARAAGGATTSTDIFAANRDQMSSPDLIRPGQVLRIPLLR